MNLLNGLLQLRKKSALLASTSYILVGTLGSQVLAIALLPILGRAYSAADFGYLGQFTAAIAVLAPIVTLSYGEAVLGAKDEGDAGGTLLLGCILSASLSLGVYIVCGALETFRPDVLPQIPMAVEVLSLGSLSAGLSSVALRSLLFTDGVARLSVCIAGQTVIAAVFPAVGFYTTSNTENFLIYGVMLGHLFTLVMCSKVITTLVRHKSWNVSKLASLFKSLRNYPLYTTPSQITTAGVIALPVLGVSLIHGPAAVGLYVMGQKIMGGPVALISKAVSQAFAAEVIKLNKLNLGTQVYKKTKRLVSIQGSIGIPVLIIISLVAFFLYPIILGAEWSKGRLIPLLLIPMYGLKIPANTVGNLFSIFHMQRLHLLRELLRGTILVVSITLLYWYSEGVLYTVAGISASACLGYLFYIRIGLKSIKQL